MLDFLNRMSYKFIGPSDPQSTPFTRWRMKKKMTPAVWLLLLTAIVGVGEVLSLAVRAVFGTP